MSTNRIRKTTIAFCMLLAVFSMLSSIPPTVASTEQSAKALTFDELMVNGEVGVAVLDTTRNTHFALNGDKPFPMQSVCKLPISIAILRLADAGKISVNDKVRIHRADVESIHSPIKDDIKGEQSDFSVRDLIRRAICHSDNTACDTLIRCAGGVDAVTAILTDAGIKGIRIDRPERVLQPESLQISKYLKDPRDTAIPEAMLDLLQKLYTGKLLSKASTSLILQDLFACKTGPHRLQAGLPRAWTLAHKTGTGRDVSGQNTATNDVGIMVGPKGETIYIAVFTKGSRATIENREAFMARVAAKAVAGSL